MQPLQVSGLDISPRRSDSQDEYKSNSDQLAVVTAATPIVDVVKYVLKAGLLDPRKESIARRTNNKA